MLKTLLLEQMKTFLKKHYDRYEIVDKNKFIEAFHYSKNALLYSQHKWISMISFAKMY